jgi:hypothetical protein
MLPEKGYLKCVLVSDKLCSHCSTVDGAMDNLARMDLASTALHPTLRTPLTLLIPLIIPSFNLSQNATSKFHCTLTHGEVEPSNVNGIDPIATSARENVATLESASNISISQMMLTTPSWRPCTRNSSRWHPIRLRPMAAVSSMV